MFKIKLNYYSIYFLHGYHAKLKLNMTCIYKKIKLLRLYDFKFYK